MDQRIKELRKSLGLTQEKFAKRIGIKRNTLANYEVGRNEPIDGIIFSMCKEFNVNEEWLRTGNGEMYNTPAENELVKQAAILLGRHDVGFEALVETYSKLSDANREILLKVGMDFFKCLSGKLEKMKGVECEQKD